MPGIAEALDGLREAVRLFVSGEARSPDGVLSSVFALNNAIGPRLRAGDRSLREFQLAVNQVTVAAKSGERKRVSDAMSALLDVFRALDAAAESDGRP